MIFNEVDFTQYCNVNVTRSILPSVSVTTKKIPGRPGERFRKSNIEPAAFSVELRLKADLKDDIASIRRILGKALWAEKPAKLILPDEPTVYYLATLRGDSPLSNLWYTGKTEIELFCPDPIAYGDTGSAEITSNSGSPVGVVGTWETAPVITCKPAAGSYHRITNVDTGETLQITRTFTGTETIVYDCEIQKTTVNGENVAILPTGDYFTLKPEVNMLARSSGTAVCKWTERYL